jgi:hypothetical protein
VRLVDGYELSYWYKEEQQFRRARQAMSHGVASIAANPDVYRRAVSFGFGIWLDYNWRRHGWNPADPSNNYFTPEQFEKTVRLAIEASDGWVWIYSETPRWWTKDGGGPLSLPDAYVEALRRARSEARPRRNALR